MQRFPAGVAVLTAEQVYQICLAAVRTADEERWRGDQEIADHFGMSVKSWRGWYESDPGLKALADDLGDDGRHLLRWRLVDVVPYLRARKRRRRAT